MLKNIYLILTEVVRMGKGYNTIQYNVLYFERVDT